MKKIRILLMTFAIATGIVAAVHARPTWSCEGYTQYYTVYGNWYQAGVYGVDYLCLSNPASVCTYYKVHLSDTYYTPCRIGILWLAPH